MKLCQCFLKLIHYQTTQFVVFSCLVSTDMQFFLCAPNPSYFFRLSLHFMCLGSGHPLYLILDQTFKSLSILLSLFRSLWMRSPLKTHWRVITCTPALSVERKYALRKGMVYLTPHTCTTVSCSS